jgi:hypothetical protein
MRHRVEPDPAEMAKRYGARPKPHMKEPDWHRPAFLWLNVRPRPSTGLLGATRLCLAPALMLALTVLVATLALVAQHRLPFHLGSPPMPSVVPTQPR